MVKFEVLLAVIAVLAMWLIAATAPKCEPTTVEFRLGHSLFAGCSAPH
jgi:hypothetical protein